MLNEGSKAKRLNLQRFNLDWNSQWIWDIGNAKWYWSVQLHAIQLLFCFGSQISIDLKIVANSTLDFPFYKYILYLMIFSFIFFFVNCVSYRMYRYRNIAPVVL